MSRTKKPGQSNPSYGSDPGASDYPIRSGRIARKYEGRERHQSDTAGELPFAMTHEDPILLLAFRCSLYCEWCGQRTAYGCDPHHVFGRGQGRLDIRENLLALCRWCHNRAHAGTIDRLLLLIVVGHREKLLVADIEATIWELRRMPKCQ